MASFYSTPEEEVPESMEDSYQDNDQAIPEFYSDDDDDTDDEEEDDDYEAVTRAFKRSPRALLGLLTTVREMKFKIASLEKEASVQLSRIAILERDNKELKERQMVFQETTVPRTYRLERAVASLASTVYPPTRPQTVPQWILDKKNELEDLLQQVVETYTPKLLCHATKIEANSKPNLEERLIFLAKHAERLIQIYRNYRPGVNFHFKPHPLDEAVVAYLRQLPADHQQSETQRYWDEIVRVYYNGRDRSVQFEMEEALRGEGTLEEKKAFLLQHLNKARALLQVEADEDQMIPSSVA